MTEDLQNELTVLEDDFNAVKKDRAGYHLVTEVQCLHLSMSCIDNTTNSIKLLLGAVWQREAPVSP